MFADLVGFTTLSEGRDAEETRELLTPLLRDCARGRSSEHGGTVEKFIGDAVMAVWGAPTAHEDDAERAVRAALEIVAAVPQLGDGAAPLQARAGVLTGEAAVTLGADQPGDGRRRHGQHRQPPAVRGRAGDRAGRRGDLPRAPNAISFEPAGEQALKGKAAPIPAWRAVAVVARRGGSGRVEHPRAAVRGPRGRAAAPQGPVRRDRPRAQVAAGDGHRPGRHRQVQARLGVREVPGRRGRHRVLARGPLPGLRRGDQLLGAGRDGAAAGGDQRGRGRADRPSEGRGAMLEQFLDDPAERRWIEPRAGGPAGAGGAADRGPRGAVRRLAHASSSGWPRGRPRCSSSSTCNGPTRGCWTSSRTCCLGRNGADLRRCAGAPGAARAAPGLGRRRPQRDPHQPGAARRRRRCASCSRDWCRACRPMPCCASWSRREGIPLYAVETVRMLLDRSCGRRRATATS